MAELHDIVDKNDKVIGQMSYAQAREEQKIIRVVHNWIINSQGRVLFQFRKASKTSYPRHYDAAVGGKVMAGESYESAVKRESEEELGIKVKPTYAGKLFVDIPYEYKFIHIYYSIHDGPFTGWEEEAESLE